MKRKSLKTGSVTYGMVGSTKSKYMCLYVRASAHVCMRVCLSY